MTKIFLDTEFTGLHQHTTLISVGLAAENGNVFYAELTDYNKTQADEWIRLNVLPLLSGNLACDAFSDAQPTVLCGGTRQEVSLALRRWLARYGGKNSVEIWADVLAWDWVLFCELFGGAMMLPEQVFYIPFDLSTLLKLKGVGPETIREELGEERWTHPILNLAKHHALYDALLEKDIFENINKR